MRKFFVIAVIIGICLYVYLSRFYWFLWPVTKPMNIERVQYKEESSTLITEGKKLLQQRKDNDAWTVFAKILINSPNDVDALWGKAEILRRNRKFDEAEEVVKQALAQDPKHLPSLLTLSYIRYSQDRLDDALSLVTTVLQSYQSKENEAMAYMLLGTINGRRASKGNIIAKLNYGTQVQCYLLKAKELAPELPEVHLALGTFYLVAPSIVGGNLNKAYEELNAAVTMAPDFATANARLAQYYRRKGDFENYTTYVDKVEELDPDNEVLKELKAQQP